MTTTALITPPRPTSPPEPTFGDVLAEAMPLIGVIPVAGPPAILLVGPLVLFALMLAGPFLLLVTFVLVLVAAAALVGVTTAIVAAPFLLVRHLIAHGAGESTRDRARIATTDLDTDVAEAARGGYALC